MQIQNVTLAQNNKSRLHNPNFTSIRSVKCEGLYKKYPDLANNLVEAFQESPTVMAFCKKYDVDVVFYAVKQMQDAVESSVHVFFDNVSKSKFRKFFDKLVGRNEDKVVLHAWGNEYSIPGSIKKSTENLIESILPERKVDGRYTGGLLDSHVRLADEAMQEVVDARAKKALAKAEKASAKKSAMTKLEIDTSDLQDSIDELMRRGS